MLSAAACGPGTQDAPPDGGNQSDGGDPAICDRIDEITSKIYVCFVIHNEEDDVGGVAGALTSIPDYNDDPAVFAHFADAMMAHAELLASHGATLSFQPDWTFTEGVERYRPTFYEDLLALGTVEIVPHAHESFVPYDALYDRLLAAGAAPEKVLGGMTFEAYLAKSAWFQAHPDYAFWGAPTATVGHVDDQPAPPMVYRIAAPGSVTQVADLYHHEASSPILVTVGLPPAINGWASFKPVGRYLSPSYLFEATRFFLAEADDTSVPARWRQDPTGSRPPDLNRSEAEVLAQTRLLLETRLQPQVDQGLVEYKTVGDLLRLYQEVEHCLDLQDQQDLSAFIPTPP